MPMKKYVIMKPKDNISLVPVIALENKLEIQRRKKEGYTVIGQVELDEKFRPEYVMIKYPKGKGYTYDT